MISPDRAFSNQVDAGRNLASVCSNPPSWVGFGIRASRALDNGPPIFGAFAVETGRKYRYI